MRRHVLILPLIALVGGAQPSQNRYGSVDVGRNAVVEFGTVLSAQPVEITGDNTGTGALIGGAAGLYGGSYIGDGTGSIGGALAGLLVGAVIGAAAEQAAQDRDGIEYIVTLESGVTQSVVQNAVEGDAPIREGDRVMVQTQGEYRRVLPAAHLPEEVERPKGVKLKKGRK